MGGNTKGKTGLTTLTPVGLVICTAFHFFKGTPPVVKERTLSFGLKKLENISIKLKIQMVNPKRIKKISFFHCCDLERKLLTGDFPSADRYSDISNYLKSSLRTSG